MISNEFKPNRSTLIPSFSLALPAAPPFSLAIVSSIYPMQRFIGITDSEINCKRFSKLFLIGFAYACKIVKKLESMMATARMILLSETKIVKTDVNKSFPYISITSQYQQDGL